MNFYKHHLGDYSAATAHLSWDEDCAYRRLMDCYYRREAPIPADKKEVYRLARASSSTQRKAIDSVLSEFFVLAEDGWHQKRCDEEIDAYVSQATTNRAIASKREAAKRERTVHEPSNEPLNESSTVTRESRAPNHKPLTTNQEPEEKKKRAAILAAVDLPLPPDLAEEWIAHRKRKRAPLTATAWDGLVAEALKANVTPEAAVRKALARGWTGFEAAWLQERMNGSSVSKQAALEQRNAQAAAEWLAGGPDAGH